MTDQENFQQRPMRTNCKQLQKNWTIFTEMSQPFTNINNKLFSLRPTPSPILSCHFLPVRRSNINNFHQLEISFLDDTQAKGLSIFWLQKCLVVVIRKLHRLIISEIKSIEVHLIGSKIFLLYFYNAYDFNLWEKKSSAKVRLIHAEQMLL